MTRSIVRIALAAAALLLPGRVAAQVPVGVVIGDTVRVASPTLGPEIRGALVAVNGDTLFVRRYGVTRAVPMSQVLRVDVRRKRSLLAGLGHGVAFGAPIGLASGYAFGRVLEGGPDRCGDDCGLISALMAVTGLGAGTVLGAITGVAAPGARWDRVYSVPSISVGAAHGGVALSIELKT